MIIQIGELSITRLESGEYQVEFEGRSSAPDRYPNIPTAIDQGLLFAARTREVSGKGAV